LKILEDGAVRCELAEDLKRRIEMQERREAAKHESPPPMDQLTLFTERRRREEPL